MKDFTEGKISKPLIGFAAPMVVGNLFQQLYSIVDAIVVGRYVGGGALAAIGVSMSAVMFIVATLIGLTTGASIVISQFFGAKQFDRLKSAVSVSIIFMAGLSVVLTVLGVIFAPYILRLLNTDPEIFDDALLYMRILMSGVIFPVFYNMYTAYLRALGDSKRPLYILIFTVILSGVLTLYLVIYQGLGVTGAAVSTIFAQFVAVILCFLYSRRYVPLLRVEKLKFDVELFRLIIKYGAPAAVQMSLVSLAGLFITGLINMFGPAAMAGITAVMRIDQLAIMPVSTLSMAMSTFVAQNMGADKEDRAIRCFKISMVYMVLFAVFVSVVLMIFGDNLVSLFLNQNDVGSAEILRIGTNYLNRMVIFYFMFAILFSFNAFFRGVGDAKIAMVFPAISLSIRTIAAYVMVLLLGMGPEALAWSIPMGWGVSGFLSWIYYKKRRWAGKTATQKIGNDSESEN